MVQYSPDVKGAVVLLINGAHLLSLFCLNSFILSLSFYVCVFSNLIHTFSEVSILSMKYKHMFSKAKFRSNTELQQCSLVDLILHFFICPSLRCSLLIFNFFLSPSSFVSPIGRIQRSLEEHQIFFSLSPPLNLQSNEAQMQSIL